MLIEMLDHHCIEQNKKAKEEEEESDHQSSILSAYDFLYLPMDFKKRLNLGYAFVNFTSSVAAMRFYRSFDNYNWEVFQTSKICKICPARIQGKDRLIGRFKHSCFECDTDDFLPVVFSPPRNGSTSFTPPSLVGRRSISLTTTTTRSSIDQ
ncbi:RNA recognition motif 2 [Macleaya cordata]|uniref:RNA recognition motif 2 n=1 Tax=Macleaya cordata TaxID=56857 RepID=A0A200R916_MACCD|nr:RNA recognition motif 2 [Macleaya cordata]